MLVFQDLIPLGAQPRFLRFYGILEPQRFVPHLHLMVVMGVSPVDGVSQQHDEPRLGDYLCHPRGYVGAKYVAGGCLSCDGLAPVPPPGWREAPTIPFDALVELVVEEVQLLGSGGLDIRMPDQAARQRSRSALSLPDGDESGEH